MSPNMKPGKILRSIGLRCIPALALCAAMSNCSKNTIEISNVGANLVYFNFRGEVYPVGSGTPPQAPVEISEIPNGTYEYSTTFVIPPNTEGEAGEGLGGTITFFRGNTTVAIMYSAVSGDSTYRVDATISTTDDVSVTSNNSSTVEPLGE